MKKLWETKGKKEKYVSSVSDRIDFSAKCSIIIYSKKI